MREERHSNLPREKIKLMVVSLFERVQRFHVCSLLTRILLEHYDEVFLCTQNGDRNDRRLVELDNSVGRKYAEMRDRTACVSLLRNSALCPGYPCMTGLSVRTRNPAKETPCVVFKDIEEYTFRVQDLHWQIKGCYHQPASVVCRERLWDWP